MWCATGHFGPQMSCGSKTANPWTYTTRPASGKIKKGDKQLRRQMIIGVLNKKVKDIFRECEGKDRLRLLKKQFLQVEMKCYALTGKRKI